MQRDYTAQDLHDDRHVTITKGDIVTDLHVGGHLTQMPEYRFDAKVFDVGGKYGIDGGRVSKLSVRKGNDLVLEYPRDWTEGEGPETHTPEQKQVLAEVQAGFPKVEQRRDIAQSETIERTASLTDRRGRGGR